MSYPTIGMTGIVADDKWDAAAVEGLLRGGIRIYEDDDMGASYFDKEKGKFIFELRVAPLAGDEPNAGVREFETFFDMAVFLAFMGKDFL